MRRMFSKNQIIDLIKNVVEESSTEVLEAIKGHDINVEGITSKGIANTGAIGNIGDVAISGDLSASGAITGGAIIENMSGYSFSEAGIVATLTKEYVYVGAVKNGNKLTIVVAMNITASEAPSASLFYGMGDFTLPSAVHNKLFPTQIGNAELLEARIISAYGASYQVPESWSGYISKLTDNKIRPVIVIPTSITAGQKYYVRYEATFLLSDNLVTQE